MMNLVRQRRIFRIRNVQKPTIVSAFWRRLELQFSTTTTIHESHPSSSSPPSSLGYPSSEMVDCLINSCGLPSEEAADICRELRNRGTVLKKARRVIGFLRESGLTDTQIRKAITCHPRLLLANPEKTLKPKVRAFLDWGLSVPEIAHILASNQRILRTSFEKKIVPVVGVLRIFITDDERVARSIKRVFSSSFSVHDFEKRMAANLSALQSRGVPDRSLSTLLVRWPRLFALKPGSLEKMAEKATKLGFHPGSGMFPKALVASSLRDSVWDAKLEVLKGFGWTQENIMVAFQKCPLFMSLSKSTLQKKLGFFMDELGYNPSELARAPTLLLYSMEGRVVPRHVVIRTLDSKKLLKRNLSLLTILGMKDEVFYEEFVLKHKDECPDMFEAYTSSIKGDTHAKSCTLTESK